MEIRQKVISALVYPAFTLLATAGTLAFMLLWMVPVFSQIYKDLHAELPPMTLFLVSVSEFLIHFGWIFVLVLVAFMVALARYYRTPEGRSTIDNLKLRMPLFGTLFLKSASANLTGSLAGLLESGVPLLHALNTAAGVCGNEVLAQAARSTSRNVTEGRKLSDEMELTGQFPLMVVRMVAIAEDVGTLPQVLREITRSYIEDVEYAVRRIVTLLEPIMVLVVAFVVGFVLLALYYPIFKIPEAFLKGA